MKQTEISSQEALEAAMLIKRYCDSVPPGSCCNCRFSNDYADGVGCVLCTNKTPDCWEFSPLTKQTEISSREALEDSNADHKKDIGLTAEECDFICQAVSYYADSGQWFALIDGETERNKRLRDSAFVKVSKYLYGG